MLSNSGNSAMLAAIRRRLVAGEPVGGAAVRISLPEAGHLEALDFALIDFTLCDGKEIVEKKMPT